MRGLLLLFVFVLSSAVGMAQIRSGETLWEDTCGYCHGNGIGPELRGRALPLDTIRAWTRYGLRQMPAFSDSTISDAELAILAEWMAAQPAQKEDRHATP